MLIEQERAQPLAVTCDCRKLEKIKSHWQAYGINPEMINYKLSNFEVWNNSSETAKNTILAYNHKFDGIRESRRNSVLLCGQSGSGKSHLCIALAINFLKRNIKTVYMPYRDVITKIKQNMINEQYYAQALLQYQTCDVLLIDDLFKGRINESDINIMFEIINYRYINFMPIIVSSEFLIEDMLAFDEAIGSRIYEMTRDYIVEIEKDRKNNYRLK